jgi:hypothetical protein
MLVLAVSPADVVSIPHDYSNQKGRACKFSVVTHFTNGKTELPKQEVFSTSDLHKATGNAAVEIARRETEMCFLRSRIDQRIDDIAAIESLGGDASSLYDANDTDEDTIDRLDDEIESLKHR